MAEALTIRPAVIAEQEALEALQWRATLSNPGNHEALIAHPDAVELPLEQIEAGDVFIALLDGTIAGFAALLRLADGAAELDGLFVEPGLWKRGIGRALLGHCCSAARGRGASLLHVIADVHAQGFYEAAGFAVTGDVQTRFGPALALQKPL